MKRFFRAAGRHRMPRLSALLLGGLLAHLLFMATPSHAATIETRPDQPHQGSMSARLPAGIQAEVHRLGMTHGDHCAIDWSVPARPIDPPQLIAVVPSVRIAPPIGLGGWRPAPRAIGPPQAGDPQALLQVFRN